MQKWQLKDRGRRLGKKENWNKHRTDDTNRKQRTIGNRNQVEDRFRKTENKKASKEGRGKWKAKRGKSGTGKFSSSGSDAKMTLVNKPRKKLLSNEPKQRSGQKPRTTARTACLRW